MNCWTCCLKLPLVPGQTRSNRGGLDDGTVPLGGATHYSNVGYPVTNKGTFLTGLEA